MSPADPLEDESRRLTELYRYDILDTGAEQSFDDLTSLAAQVCGTELAFVSFIDARRQWFKARVGFDSCETPRGVAFCAHTIRGQDLLVIPDASQDSRFCDNPMVTGPPGLRFYAGMPLVTSSGQAIGTICVAGFVPRDLAPHQQDALRRLARQAVVLLELRQSVRECSRLVAIIESSPDAIVSKTLTGTITSWNSGAERLFGYAAAEMVGQPGARLIPDGRPDEEIRLTARILQGERIEHFETLRQCKNGTPVPVSLSLFPIRDTTGVITGIGKIARDITEQELTKKRLVDFKDALDQTVDCVFLFRPDTMRFAYFNRGAAIQVGHSEAELLTMTPLDLMPEFESARFLEMTQALVDGTESCYRFETVHHHKEGRDIPVEVALQFVWTAGGEPHFIEVVRDISERRRMERVVGRSAARLKEAQRTAKIGNWEFDLTGAVFTASDEVFRIFELDAAHDVSWDAFTSVVHPEDQAAFKQVFALSMQSRAPYAIVYRLLMGNGQVKYVRQHGETYFDVDNGLPFMSVGIVQDVSEQRHAEIKLAQVAEDLEVRNQELASARDHAVAATRAKSEFLASMSHEIRTPMNAIVGMADMLQETRLSAEQQDYVDRFSRAASNLLELINDILDISKIEAGHIELESVAFDLHNVVDSTVELMAMKADAKHVQLMAFVHPDVPARLVGDPTRLRQVLVNLVGNAVKFTKRGEVIVRATPSTTRRGAFEISVFDTGIGIPATKLHAIFESFTQVDSSTTRNYGGTGLGLSISKRLVELMGGELRVASVEGIGSRFWFVVPLELYGAGAPSKATAYVTADEYGRLRGRRILIIDSNATSRMILRAHVESAGGIAIEAADEAAAVAALVDLERAGIPIDIAVIDMQTPGDGLAIAQSLRVRPGGQSLPLVLLRCDAGRGADARESPLAIAGHVFKPISRQRLLESLTKALDGPSESRSAVVARSSADPAPLRLLLVEDFEDNREIVALFLKDTPLVLDMAENGAVAVEKFQAGSYDLVLMDIQMPVMDGYQATAVMRQWERERRRAPTPIVALTANAFREDVDRSLAAGCTAHLTKPLKKKTLLAAIQEYARRAGAHDSLVA